MGDGCRAPNPDAEVPSSRYLVELSKKLAFLLKNVFPKLSCKEELKSLYPPHFPLFVRNDFGK